MISSLEFSGEIERLHRAFGAMPMDSNGSRKLAEKISEWYSIWQLRYQETAIDVLRRMVTKAISEYERIPSFAQLKAIREVVAEAPSQNIAKTICGVCHEDNGDSSGIIFAEKDGHSFSFRCHCCENWRGQYDGLPMWSGKPGYTTKPKATFSTDNERQVRGLAGMKAMAPRMYEKVIKDMPAMGHAVEALITSGWKPKGGMMSIPGVPEISDYEKESIRKESLRREAQWEQKVMREPGEDDL